MDRPWTYRELAPPRVLAAHVWSLWVHRVPADGAPYRHRSVPAGSVQLTCTVGATPRVVGPHMRATVEVLTPGTVVVGARLRPGAARALLELPASEVAGTVVDAAALWGAPAVELGERVATARSPLAAVAALQAGIAGRVGAAPDALVAELVRRLMAQPGERVASIASSLAISERQLHRRCHAAIGLGPKRLHRLLRFQVFLAGVQAQLAHGLAPAATGLARLAAEAGYADQAHLSRECAELAGLPPRAFLRETERQCGPHHDHAASFLPLLLAARA